MSEREPVDEKQKPKAGESDSSEADYPPTALERPFPNIWDESVVPRDGCVAFC